MGSMKDMFGDAPPTWAAPYPASPGYTNASTSRAAAARVAPRAGTLRAECLAAYRQDVLTSARMKQPAGLTADECAGAVGRSVLSVRPRIAELAEMGWLVDSGRRHTNDSGASAIVWVLAPEASA